MLVLFKKKENHDNWVIPKRRIPTIDELCTGKIGSVRAVLENNKRLRNDYANSTRGYTRQKNMRHILDIPMEVIFHPEMGKYFAKGMDPHERKKNRRAFLRKFPQFATVDKI